MTRAVLGALWLLGLAAGPSVVARAEAPRDSPAALRFRHDTVLRFAPRYELVFDPSAASSATHYWRRVDRIPIYERVSLDADGLVDGAVDAHVSAWGAWDTALPEDGPELSGDFALAFARARLGPASLWLGRRFLTWGVPGGLHLDGLGVEVRSGLGLVAEVIAGRPVSTVPTSLGAHSEYTQASAAFGGRLGFERPGRIAASASYLERWAHGIAADRVVGASAAVRPVRALDLSVGGTVDVRAGLEEARAQVSWLPSPPLEPDLVYVHADPQRMLPAWSLLSMFASARYDEGAIGVTTHPTPTVTARVELAARRSYVPGGDEGDEHWGTRVDAVVRWRPDPRRLEAVLDVGRREEADTAIVVGRLGASFVPVGALRVAALCGLARDEHASRRTAYLARGSAELPVSDGWATSATIELARTPIARAELSGLVRATYTFDSGAR